MGRRPEERGIKVKARVWNAEWALVEEVFKGRGMELVTSQEIPEAEGTTRGRLLGALHVSSKSKRRERMIANLKR
jgi:hypothetical protein